MFDCCRKLQKSFVYKTQAKELKETRAIDFSDQEDRVSSLVTDSFSCLGIKELTGNNDGELIQKFQQSTDNKPGDSWCMSFIYYLVSKHQNHCLHKTGSTQLQFIKVDAKYPDQVFLDSNKVKIGDVIIWQRKDNPWKGHTAIVVDVLEKGKKVVTIEGNWKNKVSLMERRIDKGYLNTDIRGFIRPFLKKEVKDDRSNKTREKTT